MHRLKKVINQHVTQATAYALFRYPEEKKVQMVMQQTAPSCHNSLEFLDHHTGFVIVPFSISKQYPAVCIKPDFSFTYPQPEDDSECISNLKFEPTKNTNKQLYIKDFNSFIHAIREDRFHKLVLARCEEIMCNGANDVQPVELFLKACNYYPHQYIALCHTPATGTWLVATPEPLLTGRCNEWQTVALAGTMPYASLKDSSNLVEWTEKNRKEQDYVVQYIRDVLNSMDACIEQTPPYVMQAANVAHLCTKFRFSFPANNVSLGRLIEQLYPTPAVCGLPKEEAKLFIANNECTPRRYYAGFMGMHTPQSTNFYVSLRCMQLCTGLYRLYAGGGILSQSNVESEWTETQNKMCIMRNLLTK